MGVFDKIKGMVNPEGMDDNYDDDYIYDDVEENDGYNDYQASSQNAGYQQPQQPQRSANMSLNSSALELKVVRPERFDSVNQIADHLLNKRTVVLNLEATNKETARRLIDFLSGVAYSIDGSLKRVAANTFVITPNNVDVSGEQLREQQQRQQQPADDTFLNNFRIGYNFIEAVCRHADVIFGFRIAVFIRLITSVTIFQGGV